MARVPGLAVQPSWHSPGPEKSFTVSELYAEEYGNDEFAVRDPDIRFSSPRG